MLSNCSLDTKTSGQHVFNDAQAHVCLDGRRLEEFRTKQCALYIKGICADSTRCSMSHSETWPRRNPAQFRYEYKLCPNIQFFRLDNKMQLHGKCHYGRRCRYSHSKEEQLYHPDLYKTRLCLNYPNCKGYYCPFAHSQNELQHRAESNMRNEKDSERNSGICKNSVFYNGSADNQNHDGPAIRNHEELSLSGPNRNNVVLSGNKDNLKKPSPQNLSDGNDLTMGNIDEASNASSEDSKPDCNSFDAASLNSTISSPITVISNQNIHGKSDFALENDAKLSYNLKDGNVKDIFVQSSNDTQFVDTPKTKLDTSLSLFDEDDEEDDWFEVVLKAGLKLLSEEEDASNTALNETINRTGTDADIHENCTRICCTHCPNARECVIHSFKGLSENWWL